MKINELKIGYVISIKKMPGEYVVSEVKKEFCPGPHTEPGFFVYYMAIQKLKKDGTFTEKAPVKTFYDCSLFSNWCKEEDIVFKRKMRKKAYFVEKIIKKKVKKYMFY